MALSLSSTKVFKKEKTGNDTMSARAFVVTITVFIAAGFLISAYAASLTFDMNLGWWQLLAFVVSVAGVIISAKSNNWLISLGGYFMVVVPMGMVAGPLVHLYTPASVVKVLGITVCVTLGTGIAGAIYPKDVSVLRGILFVSLLALISGEFVAILLPRFGIANTGVLHWMDWVGVFLFSAYIFVDMNRAMRLDHTLDNAVDTAVALYLDIFNLFLELLDLFGETTNAGQPQH